MKRLIALASLIVLLSSCTLVSKKEPEVAPADVKKQLGRIEIDINAKAYKKALKQLTTITQKYSTTDAADDAYILMGNVYCTLQDYTNCYRAYIAVIDSDIFSPREIDAATGAAGALLKLGRFDEALSMTDRALKVKNASSDSRLQVYELRYKILLQTGDRLQTLKTLVFLADSNKSEEQKRRYKIRATEIVESNLSDEELEKVASEPAFGGVRAIALFRVGSTYFEQRDYSRAESYLNRLISLEHFLFSF